MTLTLHAHPFSSYCQKALIALYEAGTRFETVLLEGAACEALRAIWPMGKFPVLVDDSRNATIPEASLIVEYLDLHCPGPARLIPEDRAAALDVRLLDRFFDNYISTPQQKIVSDRLRQDGEHDHKGVVEAHVMIATAYRWLDTRMADRVWACGERFGLADCGAAPFLFYADWVQPLDDTLPNLKAYLRRLRERPSVLRAIDEARPYRHYFPGGVPDHAD